jgi:hypothetical protein
MLGSAAADDVAALNALLSEAFARGDRRVAVEDRPGLRGLTATAGIVEVHDRGYALYVRVADPPAFLDAVKSVLSARLATSTFAGLTNVFLLSLYSSSVQLRIERGEVLEVKRGPGVQDPIGAKGVGVPPDLVATLFFGRFGARGMTERFDDVRPGTRVDLLDTLFPSLTYDLSLSL